MTMYSLSQTIRPDANEFEQLRLFCDAGDIAFNGGSSLILETGKIIENYQSFPIFNSTIKADVGWQVALEMDSGNSSAIRGFVTCLDNPPLRP